jgi:excinuclease ABC subunit C
MNHTTESTRLNKILTKLPRSPGVYFFYGPKKELLYIGKATDLRSRVNSYFQKNSSIDQRLIESFIDQVETIKWQVTDSTLEALILESNLISQLQPKFNIDARDDKTFLGIYITHEDFPRIFPARITNKKLPEGEFFGPYTSAMKVKQALKILRRIFPWCNERIKLRRACLYYHLKLCPGPCVGAINQPDYQQTINHLKLFLRGQKKQLIKDLKRQMHDAAKTKNFEQAARLRDEFNALQHIHDITLQLTNQVIQLTRQQPWRLKIEGYDISNISGHWAVGSMVTFVDGRPAKDFYRRFKIRTIAGVDDVGMMEEVIKRRLEHAGIKNHELRIMDKIPKIQDYWPLPDLMLIDGGVGHYHAVKKVLDQNKIKLYLLAIAKGQKRKNADLFGNLADIKKYQPLLPMLMQVRDEAHRFAISYHRKVRSKSLII